MRAAPNAHARNQIGPIMVPFFAESQSNCITLIEADTYYASRDPDCRNRCVKRRVRARRFNRDVHTPKPIPSLNFQPHPATLSSIYRIDGFRRAKGNGEVSACCEWICHNYGRSTTQHRKLRSKQANCTEPRNQHAISHLYPGIVNCLQRHRPQAYKKCRFQRCVSWQHCYRIAKLALSINIYNCFVLMRRPRVQNVADPYAFDAAPNFCNLTHHFIAEHVWIVFGIVSAVHKGTECRIKVLTSKGRGSSDKMKLRAVTNCANQALESNFSWRQFPLGINLADYNFAR